MTLCFSSEDGMSRCACAPRPLEQIGLKEWDEKDFFHIEIHSWRYRTDFSRLNLQLFGGARSRLSL